LERKTEALEDITESGDTKILSIDRNIIVQDMLQFYSNNDTVDSILSVRFKDEPAIDFDGVKREAFTLFWEKAFPLYFEGTASYVSRISPSIEESIYISLGRILSHGYVMAGVFPTLINKVFFSIILCGKDSVSDEDFLEGFLEYVSSYDSIKLKKILEECSGDKLSRVSTDFLIALLSEFGVTKMLNVNNLKSIIISVAKTELFSKTIMAANAIKEGLCKGAQGKMWLSATPELVNDLNKSLQVTTEKMISLISIHDSYDLTKGKEVVLTYFKRYVRDLDGRELARFLRFITGSSALAVSSIKVIFHTHVGTLPHISVHACSAVVDLPSCGYDSFSDFRSQMNEVLNNADTWKFSLV